LVDDVRTVIADLAPIRREVRSRGQRWYDIRLRPYRTVDDKIDGVVISFIDVTDRRKTEDALRESEERLRQEMRLVELSSEPIFIWNLDDGIVEWNRGSEELYGWSRQEALGRNKEDLLKISVPESTFADLKQELINKGSWSGELRQKTKDGRNLVVETRMELRPMGGLRLVLESTRDIPSASVGRAGRRRWFANSPTA
jgi:two-component system CheB/CheR fusion protein